ncbi:hypothetical protein ACFZBU_46910 [Embleya sp. NPDC008237]|uniref:hypothetical protein n=1 Tax=Embleya sp. NPDC008237 TaxID=3363978 RepID=UPI0036ECBFE8
MDYRPVLAAHAVPLTHDIPEWNKAAGVTGLESYECKAFYICGVMREFIQTSGLTLKSDYHLGALFAALNAAELLGRVVCGARRKGAREKSATDALRLGLEYLEEHKGPLAEDLRLSRDEYVNLRNFAGHGATYLPTGVRFDPDSTRLLLVRLAHALDTMWSDTDLPDNLAAVEIHPVWTHVKGKPEPVYVRNVRAHLVTKSPSEGLDHADSWRTRIVSLDASSPPVTGRG